MQNTKGLMLLNVFCVLLNLSASQKSDLELGKHGNGSRLRTVNRLQIPKETKDALNKVLLDKQGKQKKLAELAGSLGLERRDGIKAKIKEAITKDKLHPDWIVIDVKGEGGLNKKPLTPLGIAILSYDRDFAKDLLEHGANPNNLDYYDEWQYRGGNKWRCSYGSQPRKCVLVNGLCASAETAELLLKHGAAPLLRKYNNELLEHATERVCHFDCIHVYLRYGVNPNVHLQHGLMPLARLPGALREEFRSIRYDRYADDGAKLRERQKAVEKTKAAIVDFIRSGARLDLRDGDGPTFPQILRRQEKIDKADNGGELALYGRELPEWRNAMGVLRNAAKEEWNKKRLEYGKQSTMKFPDYETLELEPVEDA